MMTKTSLVLAAFAAAIAAQPASASIVTGDLPGTAASAPALIRPSAAALEQLQSRIEDSRITVAAVRKAPRVFVEENGPSFVRAVKK
jgi:hypothetical protein